MSGPQVPSCRNCLTNNLVKLITPGKFSLYQCLRCQNGFIDPLPKNLDLFYPADYWQFPGTLASLRQAIHIRWQHRRAKYLQPYLRQGTILDVGAGEGVFGQILQKRYTVTNLEYPTAHVSNPKVIKADFLKWQTNLRFDGIVFLESLEHVPNPQQYLQKAASLLKKGGYIFIEAPRFDSLESQLLGQDWLPRDIPRHLAHFTNPGLQILAQRVGLKTVKQAGVLSYEYSPYILLVSLSRKLGLPPLNLRQLSLNNLSILIFSLIMFPIAVLFETIFYWIKQAPIGLTVLRKK